MDIKRSGSQPSTIGPVVYFTGTVHIDPLFQAHYPGRAVGGTPSSVAIDYAAHKAYVTNSGSNTMSIIDKSTDKVVTTISVGKLQLELLMDIL